MRNKRIAAVAGVAAIMVIGGTWAYFNQSSVIENPFSTGKYDNIVYEDFNPDEGEDWKPGATVNKDVEVENTGDYDLFVRVKFDEKWTDKNSNAVRKEVKNMGDTTGQQDTNDGLVAGDDSVVKKNFANSDKWEYNNTDGYWYYKTNLAKKTSTGIFLDSVTLLENADMGSFTTTKYYTKAATRPAAGAIGTDDTTQWVAYTGTVPEGSTHNIAVSKLDPNKPGYADANYTLTITVETVQATEQAMKATFGLTDKLSGWTYTEQ